jgi:hypothetical protein
MAGQDDVLKAVKNAFSDTVMLKLKQFYEVVPKGSNPALTGGFVETIVRSFVRDWIGPCQLCHGTLHPHDLAGNHLPDEQKGPKQIDGIVYDPRLGPAVIREGEFVIAHPAFCRGIVEIKTSEGDLRQFEERLQGHYRQYLFPAWEGRNVVEANDVMGIVIHDSAPDLRTASYTQGTFPLYEFSYWGHCPIFILFRQQEGDYEPYEPAIDAMIKAIYKSGWQSEYNGSMIRGETLPQ